MCSEDPITAATVISFTPRQVLGRWHCHSEVKRQQRAGVGSDE